MRTLSLPVLFMALCLSVTPALAADEHTPRMSGERFTCVGTVEDFNAQNVRVSVGCSTEVAARVQ